MLSLTELQKKTAQGIVTIFETSRLAGPNAYSQVTLMNGDTGGLTYGREQTTLMSGNLYLLMQDYVDHGGQYAREFRRFLDPMKRCDATLNRDSQLKSLLKDAGADPIMRSVQDAFFDRVYWAPAEREVNERNFTLPLSASVVYDSIVHGSWERIQARVGVPVSDEKGWIKAYLTARRSWLATHSNTLLHACVYRQDAYFRLIDQNAWMLDLPLLVRGVTITPQALGSIAASTPVDLDHFDPPTESAKDGSDVKRLLFKDSPPMIGADVRSLQEALVTQGYPITTDSVFGPTTETAVKLFQASHGLKADGMVGPATRAALGIK